jgi:DtxR family Mn-dependent transcriptional regulator
MEIEHTGNLRIKLTPAQQDYLEACYMLEQRVSGGPVRVTDIAELLGTRLPTVTRSVATLRRIGLVAQEARGPVELTQAGRALAKQLRHRHEDVRRLLTEVLGVGQRIAEHEACVLEHGLSGVSAQRLHEFLLRWDGLPVEQRDYLRGLAGPLRVTEFSLVGRARGAGRRR